MHLTLCGLTGKTETFVSNILNVFIGIRQFVWFVAISAGAMILILVETVRWGEKSDITIVTCYFRVVYILSRDEQVKDKSEEDEELTNPVPVEL